MEPNAYSGVAKCGTGQSCWARELDDPIGPSEITGSYVFHNFVKYEVKPGYAFFKTGRPGLVLTGEDDGGQEDVHAGARPARESPQLWASCAGDISDSIFPHIRTPDLIDANFFDGSYMLRLRASSTKFFREKFPAG